MEVVTGEQMRIADAHAIETLGIPGLLLMEAAGRGVASAFLEDCPDAALRGVVILCGKGNNGGDGLVVARYLAEAGVRSRVLLFARADELRGDPRVNFRTARATGVEIVEITAVEEWRRLAGNLRSGTFVVDALLGTGVRGGARGLIGEVIEDVNASGLDVASVDLPSGLDADRGSHGGSALRARMTYTLCRPKLPMVTGLADAYVGRFRVIPIGIPDESVARARPELEWLDRDATRRMLKPRRTGAHKGNFGHLLIVAGSRGKSGAAVLTARAALRSGTGLVTVATPASVRPEVAAGQVEVMTEPLAETADGSISDDAVSPAMTLLASRDALAIGPGLGTLGPTPSAVREILNTASNPIVVDADALNGLVSGESDALRMPEGSQLTRVLTPHPGEAARLLRTTTAGIQEDRLAAARTLAASTGAVVVLKGYRTVVAMPDGRASFNSTGNPGLATAGTGDVLTGMVGAFLARGLDARDSARLGVFLHGLAADLAVEVRGQDGLMASDVIDRIPDALRCE